MKAQLLMLSAAGLIVAGAAHSAEPPEVRRFLDGGRAVAEAQLAKAGVDLAGQTVAVRGVVVGGGRLNNLRVVRSTGSRDRDEAVAKALNRLRLEDPPLLLSGSQVTLTLGAPATTAASQPAAGGGG
jgi:hypothetical protein